MQESVVFNFDHNQSNHPLNHCIHQLFEEQVERNPDAVAVVFQEQQLTYRQLNHQANQLAKYLQTLGVSAEVLVGICMERSLEMVIGLLAILKAGGAYVPLDIGYPQERLAFMLADTQVTVLLTQKALVDRLPQHNATTVCVDEDWDQINQQPHHNLTTSIKPENLAYVMYTSGSTGQPKGVCVVHRGVVRLVKETNYASFTASEVFLQLAPISFDATTFEIWGSLLNGGLLVIFPTNTPSLDELAQVIHQYQVTTLWLTAGLFHLIVDEKIEALKPLRQLLAGGDVLSVPHVQKFLQTVENCRLINGYGPTENTTFTCCYEITLPLKPDLSIPIGQAIAHTQVYILDDNLQPVAPGMVGELYVGGDGLARGYLNRPELTVEKFIPYPWKNSASASERLYKTGDLVRSLPDGNIEFLGRIDNQVKIRGFRIELGEIERVIGQYPEIRENIVIARPHVTGEKQLVAYIVTHQGSTYKQNQLSAFLQQRLPEYMLPSAFVVLASLPLTANGKVDRQKLPAPGRERPQLEQVYIAPQNDLERLLVNIYADLLQIDQVGVDDNFFDLGGTSILIMQLALRVKQELGMELSVVKLFQYPTIAGLAQYLNAQLNAQQNTQQSPDKLQSRAQQQKAALARRRHSQRGM
ncbi:amino acid adenylation domain-containing protein [Nostoc sp. TCL26-01]|uniref:non-ribosomal peptide synthetase n=1 Tax=Nostoc sp. TCL26-01 TaxID=2576904 RepID=UPI001C4B30FE|nr:non-ribosomal peptide synthetase [Nostoc sp. TCL26-01]